MPYLMKEKDKKIIKELKNVIAEFNRISEELKKLDFKIVLTAGGHIKGYLYPGDTIEISKIKKTVKIDNDLGIEYEGWL